MGSLRVALRLAATTLCLATPRLAQAFECSRVPLCPDSDPSCDDPRPALCQVWNQRCVPVWIRRDDPIFGPETEALVERSFARWTSDLACTDFEVIVVGYTDDTGGFNGDEPDDQRNVLFATRSQAEIDRWFDDPNLLALTLTTFSVETGEIFDADIVFRNAPDNGFGEVDNLAGCIAAGRPFDIENTLVHEIGHLLGYDHVSDTEATMFERAERCEVLKRDLAPNDVNAMCSTYPAGQGPQPQLPPVSFNISGADRFRDQCERALESGCGCASTSPLPAPYPPLAALLLALVAWLRRARGGRPR